MSAPGGRSGGRARGRRQAEPDPDDEDVQAAPVDAFQRLRRGDAVAAAAEADGGDEHAWMTTYTDMVTLLLTCFIMLVSLASFGGKAPLPEIMAPPPLPAVLPPAADEMPDALFLRQPPDHWSARLSRELGRFAARAAAAGGMAVEEGEAQVTVRLDDRLLFPSARAELETAGLSVLHELAPVLASAPVRIEVQGHTDAVPISSWLFPSNWELSAARAAAVVRALIDAGIPPGRLTAVGYADTVPRAGNGTPDGRRENRRVELVLRAPFDPPEALPIAPPEAVRSYRMPP